jgi:adenylate cyclase
VLASLAVSAAVIGANQSGLLEGIERLAYDQMVRLRHGGRQLLDSELPQDDRLLIVTITESDLEQLAEFPLTDQTVAQAIAQLQQHNPTVIGLDMYRAIAKPPGRDELLEIFEAGNVIAITKRADPRHPAIPPPEGISPDQVGFNDVIVDGDGAIRRSLIMGTEIAPDGSSQLLLSLSLRLAFFYLSTEGIEPKANPDNPDIMQLGPTPFTRLQPGSGGYGRTDAGGYQVMLDYRHPLTPAREVTLAEVLANQVDPDWIEGKIILIGPTAPSLKDLFYTPFTGGGVADTHKMPGVVIHAQMVSQILDAATGTRPLLWTSNAWQEGLWIGLWALFSGGLAWRFREPVRLGSTQTGLIFGLAVASFGLFLLRGWVPVVAPAIAMVGTSSLVIASQAQQLARQRQMMLLLLGQNTSPEVANALWENRDRLLKSGKLPGKKAIATMLFTDIRGFSTLAERTSPEILLDWLNEYLSAMAEAIQSHHGIINKFTGDGLMAVFGVPIIRESQGAICQDAAAAVSCALEMTNRLQRLNHQRQRQGLDPLQMRVGIFTGAVVVGSLGGQTRMEYGVIGDSVNIASRLESLDKGRQGSNCRILIGHDAEGIWPQIRAQFQVEDWGELILKGREHPVTVYQVLGATAETTTTPFEKVANPSQLLSS